MKKTITYFDGKQQCERQVNYIPCRYIIAIILAETLAVISAVVLLTIFVPYFYIAVILTQAGVVIQIIASNAIRTAKSRGFCLY